MSISNNIEEGKKWTLLVKYITADAPKYVVYVLGAIVSKKQRRLPRTEMPTKAPSMFGFSMYP